MQNNGYLLVASVNKAYYKAALRCAESLLDFYPDARITLFTHEDWVCDDARQLFDTIITEDVPVHIRAKLWALSKTPYDLTLYLDCDTVVQHEDISNVFDLIGDNDIIFTRNRPYNAKITKLSDTEEMIYHCGLFLYRNNQQTKDLMDNWYLNYLDQRKESWDPSPYSEEVRKWDTFTMWALLNKTDHRVVVGEFPQPDARWNFVNGYKYEELQGTEPVIYHYTFPAGERENGEIYRSKN